ncbi:hypothetical protein ACHAWF_005055 [Thalassiosira exigua]
MAAAFSAPVASAVTAYQASSRSSRLFFSALSMVSPTSPTAAARAAVAASISNRQNPSMSLPDVHDNDTNIALAIKPLKAKRVLFLRHGQAVHNPRAEAARESGCSFETFLRLMEEDDALDADLTDLGQKQAIDAGQQAHVRHAFRDIQMIVSSPLSRALRTADLVHPPSDLSLSSSATLSPRRVCIEQFREINGKLLNGQRLPRTTLESEFPRWDFSQIPAIDESWTEELESRDVCSERGYKGLMWIMQQNEERILLVCHGGLLNLTMNNNPKVVLVDGRNAQRDEEKMRCITTRFGNCELREFIMTMWDCGQEANTNSNVAEFITLEEVSMEMRH